MLLVAPQVRHFECIVCGCHRSQDLRSHQGAFQCADLQKIVLLQFLTEFTGRKEAHGQLASALSLHRFGELLERLIEKTVHAEGVVDPHLLRGGGAGKERVSADQADHREELQYAKDTWHGSILPKCCRNGFASSLKSLRTNVIHLVDPTTTDKELCLHPLGGISNAECLTLRKIDETLGRDDLDVHLIMRFQIA